MRYVSPCYIGKLMYVCRTKRCFHQKILIGISESDSHIFEQILLFTSRFVRREPRALNKGTLRKECCLRRFKYILWISSYVVPDRINCHHRSILSEADVKCHEPFPVNSVNIVDTLCCDQSGSSSLKGWLEAALVKSNVEASVVNII